MKLATIQHRVYSTCICSEGCRRACLKIATDVLCNKRMYVFLLISLFDLSCIFAFVCPQGIIPVLEYCVNPIYMVAMSTV